MAHRFVVIGGGPAGNQAATTAARLGARVTMIERDVIGGAAHLRDCIPSKAMIATGGAMNDMRRAIGMGLGAVEPVLDLDGLRDRIGGIEDRLEQSVSSLLADQGVRIIAGTGRLVGSHEVEVTPLDGGAPEVIPADTVVLATGSRPRIPDFAEIDGERVLTTRHAYPPPGLPEHLVVIGSGVTGVEFVHMFSAFGSQVTLIVSRQQVLPSKDPEVAAALEEDFLHRGVSLLKGARAVGIDRSDGARAAGSGQDGARAAGSGQDGVVVRCDDGRHAAGSHALLCIGSVPSSDGLGLDAAGVETDGGGYIPINQHCQSNVAHIYAAGDLSGKLPLSSVASMQGRKVAEHVMGFHTRAHRHLDYEKAASAIFTEPEIADVGLAEVDAFAEGRKIRVTKVPFSASAKALINDDPRGFVKIISDPATGVVLGGSIVGRHAAELVSVIALAVTAGLKVNDIVESLLVHPSLSEALAEAAE
ncbi:MAG: FAD-dependent oxidoreductase [Acidimicrobiia bacterium]|nr:FAD-dependent oxidoreductase [Acidimicrobiia bacterium]